MNNQGKGDISQGREGTPISVPITLAYMALDAHISDDDSVCMQRHRGGGVCMCVRKWSKAQVGPKKETRLTRRDKNNVDRWWW